MYDFLLHLHLWTVLPCIPLGAFLLAKSKGTQLHRRLGGVYMSLMFFTAAVSLFIPALVGPRVLGHFGWIHLLSILVIVTVPRALIDVRAGRIKAHQRRMVMLYVGALLIAGAFTLWPGRYLHGVLFG